MIQATNNFKPGEFSPGNTTVSGTNHSSDLVSNVAQMLTAVSAASSAFVGGTTIGNPSIGIQPPASFGNGMCSTTIASLTDAFANVPSSNNKRKSSLDSLMFDQTNGSTNLSSNHPLRQQQHHHLSSSFEPTLNGLNETIKSLSVTSGSSGGSIIDGFGGGLNSSFFNFINSNGACSPIASSSSTTNLTSPVSTTTASNMPASTLQEIHNYFLRRSKYCLQMDLYESAIPEAKVALNFNPFSLEAKYLIALSLSGMKRYHEAENQLISIYKMDSTNELYRKELIRNREQALLNMCLLVDPLQVRIAAEKFDTIDEATQALLRCLSSSSSKTDKTDEDWLSVNGPSIDEIADQILRDRTNKQTPPSSSSTLPIPLSSFFNEEKTIANSVNLPTSSGAFGFSRALDRTPSSVLISNSSIKPPPGLKPNHLPLSSPSTSSSNLSNSSNNQLADLLKRSFSPFSSHSLPTSVSPPSLTTNPVFGGGGFFDNSSLLLPATSHPFSVSNSFLSSNSLIGQNLTSTSSCNGHSSTGIIGGSQFGLFNSTNDEMAKRQNSDEKSSIVPGTQRLDQSSSFLNQDLIDNFMRTSGCEENGEKFKHETKGLSPVGVRDSRSIKDSSLSDPPKQQMFTPFNQLNNKKLFFNIQKKMFELSEVNNNWNQFRNANNGEALVDSNELLNGQHQDYSSHDNRYADCSEDINGVMPHVSEMDSSDNGNNRPSFSDILKKNKEKFKENIQKWESKAVRSNSTSSGNGTSVANTDGPRAPTNLWGYHGLRVAHVSPNARSTALQSLFERFGKVKKIERIQHKVNKNNIWVFYDNPNSPVEAIVQLQGVHMENVSVDSQTPLRLFFAPTDEQVELKFSRPRQPPDNQGECYYWRTTNCFSAENCFNLHIPANRNIDTQIWMKLNQEANNNSNNTNNDKNSINDDNASSTNGD